VSILQAANVRDGWYDFPGYAETAYAVVPSNVVRNESKERRERTWSAAGVGLGKLRDRLDVVAQNSDVPWFGRIEIG
jgi:hypothetical protein